MNDNFMFHYWFLGPSVYFPNEQFLELQTLTLDEYVTIFNQHPRHEHSFVHFYTDFVYSLQV